MGGGYHLLQDGLGVPGVRVHRVDLELPALHHNPQSLAVPGSERKTVLTPFEVVPFCLQQTFWSVISDDQSGVSRVF